MMYGECGREGYVWCLGVEIRLLDVLESCINFFRKIRLDVKEMIEVFECMVRVVLCKCFVRVGDVGD